MEKDKKKGISRRGFLTTAAAGTVVGAGVVAGIKPGEVEASAGKLSSHVPPGKLDDYYGFWSGGQSGEVRILGIPSMRELKRIPVYNHCSATGYGTTDASKKLMKKGRKVMNSGDTHHCHLSYDKGTYDGKYAYINDKLNARLGRIRLDYMETDASVDLPNCQGTHGIFPMRVRKGKTYYVFCNSEFRTPQPNDGRDMEDPTKYGALHTAVDGEKMKVKWQVRVTGNLDLCATDHKGTLSMATCYNSEEATDLGGMMAKDRDWAVFFNTANIEKAVRGKKYSKIGKSKVPVVDGRKGKGEGNITVYVPVPKSPHGINLTPDGKYAICSGKLSPTCTIIDLEKVRDLFKGKGTPEGCVVGQPEVGLGPLHTLCDNRGHAYTSVFLDSQVTKWDINKAIKQYKEKDPKKAAKINPIVDKIDVHYQIGHLNTSMGETNEADGKWLVALCKFSKDRFLNCGPRHPENDQLIDISGKKMRLVHDGATHAEPHDAVIVRRDLINPKKVYDPNDKMFDKIKKQAKKDGVDLGDDDKVVRIGKRKVRVYMTSSAPEFGMTEFKVKKGDTVQIILTNNDDVQDLGHAFALCNHGISFGVMPGQTVTATFKANQKGMYWYYCTWFCHALHLEMRGRMIVE